MRMRSTVEWSVKIHEAFHYKESIERIVRAIQRDALETAMDICHKHAIGWPSGVGYQACRECAHAIGDLIPEEPKP